MTFPFSQSPAEVVDYTLDWSPLLGTDTITSSLWVSLTAGVMLSSQSNTSSTTTFWITGGVIGNSYEILNTITTAGGRTYQNSITITMIQK